MRFQSTLPARGATSGSDLPPNSRGISIHAPREGSDYHLPPTRTAPLHFNPRSPRGERPLVFLLSSLYHSDFNPRSPRGERQLRRHPRTLHAAFQSTLPARGATAQLLRCSPQLRNFNPRSPRGERRLRRGWMTANAAFQSTLPARGATFFLFSVAIGRHSFQSTLPARGATRSPAPPGRRCGISIHAPREGSDEGASGAAPGLDISIHAPREGSDTQPPPTI